MCSINVKQVFDPNIWGKELNEFQYGIFITNKWLSAIARSNEAPIYFDFKKGEKTVAKIAGLSIKNRRKKPDILYFYSGIAYKTFNEKLIHSCNNQLIIFAKTHGYDKVIIKSYDYSEEFSIKTKNLFAERRRLEYLIDLTIDEQTIYRRFNKKARYYIRKAKGCGSTVHESQSLDLLKLLLEYLNKTHEIRISKGYSNYNIFFLRNFDEYTLISLLKNGTAIMYYVQTNNDINSIQYILVHNGKASGLLMGTTQEGYDLHSPVFLEYTIMLLLKSRGYSIYNLGGIPFHSSHRGLIQYKKSIGAYSVNLQDQNTYFLLFPLKILNPLIMIINRLPDNGLAKLLIKVLRKIIKLFVIDDD